MSKTLKKEDGDILIQESNGRPYLVSGTEKLNQDIADCLMITYDPTRDFGHELDKLFISDSRLSFLGVITSTYIKNRVEEAINRLKSAQQSRQDQLNNYEAIDKIRDIQVFRLKNTEYAFIVDVTPIAGPDKNPASFSVKLGHQLLETDRKDLPGMNLYDNA